jgi:hypothetical protein
MKKHCVYDTLHEYSFNLNRMINKCCSHVFIGIGQVIFDLIVPLMLIHWYFNFKIGLFFLKITE